MKFSEVMIYYDYNMSAIAKALGTTRQCVSIWKKNNKIPYRSQCELQINTNGKLIASKTD
jgi:transcriptional regulator